MKGRSRNAAEKAYQDKIAAVGCICCLHDGIYNPYVLLHHIAGRTAPGAHYKVLPLCASHHMDDGSGAIAVHPWKKRFEQAYGAQLELLEEVRLLAGIAGNEKAGVSSN
jgi:hypothetical protein